MDIVKTVDESVVAVVIGYDVVVDRVHLSVGWVGPEMERVVVVVAVEDVAAVIVETLSPEQHER
jgi:hypothetical protein